jgi:DNA-binding XRE family transcriptional regulator
MKSDSPSIFGSTLRQRRRRLGLSQDDVANAIGVNRRVIGELEAGKPSVELRIAIEAARAVGLDIDLRPR